MKKKKFVIQKHAARALHYDFRLEVDGVLKSWAVPKGPSLNPKDKRLAIMTTDHALSYAHFEGVIPKGEYGAGVVMIWDKGTYKNIKTKNEKQVSMKKCIKNGQIEVFLEGKKLKGGYSLIRMQEDNWLLIKMRDEYADARKNPVKSELRSAETGRTLNEIKKYSKS
jgi:DNA ligase D-like protein (predicted 3'-phosphoesterase)